MAVTEFAKRAAMSSLHTIRSVSYRLVLLTAEHSDDNAAFEMQLKRYANIASTPTVLGLTYSSRASKYALLM